MTPQPPAPYPSGSLVRLLAAARAGCAASQNDLLTALHFTILRYLVRRLEPRCDAADLADDLAQETLVRILTRLGDCRAESDAQVHAWALSVAHTRMIDHLRRARSTAPLRIMDPAVSETVPERAAPSHPEQLVRRLIRGILASLPAEATELLHMRAGGSPPWEEVGDALRTTPAGAKRRFQRLQVRLRHALGAAVRALPPEDRVEVERRFRVLAEPHGPPETR